MWPKEVYRDRELLPLAHDLNFGPVVGVSGPRTPVLLLKRAFGADCFDVYYQSGSHHTPSKHQLVDKPTDGSPDVVTLAPLVAAGGAWESSPKVPLEDAHYIPMQPEPKAKRRPTAHCRAALDAYLPVQVAREAQWLQREPTAMGAPPLEVARSATTDVSEVASELAGERRVQLAPPPSSPPRRTVYMDGVFDLFHVGHLRAIQQCATLGDRVIVGVTGDVDAAAYKRPPIISQADRVAVVEAVRGVSKVVCPCPLVVTDAFMAEHGIDLVVHGFADPSDEERQAHFFAAPRAAGKFQVIDYYRALSTSDIIAKVRGLALS
jgi:cytidyltransferase-like protein